MAEKWIQGAIKHPGALRKELGAKKVIYYKLTVKATDIKTGIITWTDEKEIKKLFKKRSYAM